MSCTYLNEISSVTTDEKKAFYDTKNKNQFFIESFKDGKLVIIPTFGTPLSSLVKTAIGCFNPKSNASCKISELYAKKETVQIQEITIRFTTEDYVVTKETIEDDFMKRFFLNYDKRIINSGVRRVVL